MNLEITERAVINYEAEQHFKRNGDRIKEVNNNENFTIHRGYLTKYAARRLDMNWQDAEDVVQDAYVKVLETAKVNELFNFAGLYKIWLDRCISDKKIINKRTESTFVEDVIIDERDQLSLIDLAESEDASQEILLDLQERVNRFVENTNRFKPKVKAMIRLYLLFGYSHEEVSDMLNVPEKAVYNAVAYFRKLYREE